ncbi:MAG: hypothetical protein ACREXQ_00535 [Polaromonas sp.]
MQRQLRSLLGHEHIVAQAYGRYLLIKRLDDGEPTVVARLTELGRDRYCAGDCACHGPPGPPLQNLAIILIFTRMMA